MTEREFLLLKFYMMIRARVASALGGALGLILVVLVFMLRSEGTNETLTTLLGIGIGALATGLGTVLFAVGRDVTEHIERMRGLPDKFDKQFAAVNPSGDVLGDEPPSGDGGV